MLIEISQSFAPLDIAHHTNGGGIQALFAHFDVPSDFISQRLESVTHSFSAVRDGPSYCKSDHAYSPDLHSSLAIDSYFHFLCKHITITTAEGRPPGIADLRGAVLSQGDWTWIRTSVFMRWNKCNDKDQASVALILFSASPEMRDRFKRLWKTDLSKVPVDPFSLFVICLDELWLQAQGTVRAVSDVFNAMERVS